MRDVTIFIDMIRWGARKDYDSLRINTYQGPGGERGILDYWTKVGRYRITDQIEYKLMRKETRYIKVALLDQSSHVSDAITKGVDPNNVGDRHACFRLREDGRWKMEIRRWKMGKGRTSGSEPRN